MCVAAGEARTSGGSGSSSHTAQGRGRSASLSWGCSQEPAAQRARWFTASSTLPCVFTTHLLHTCCALPAALTLTPQVLTSKAEIEMWGDGKQTRSFTYIDDCVEGILRVTKSDFREPLNLGSSEMVSMNEMMALAMGFEDKVGCCCVFVMCVCWGRCVCSGRCV